MCIGKSDGSRGGKKLKKLIYLALFIPAIALAVTMDEFNNYLFGELSVGNSTQEAPIAYASISTPKLREKRELDVVVYGAYNTPASGAANMNFKLRCVGNPSGGMGGGNLLSGIEVKGSNGQIIVPFQLKAHIARYEDGGAQNRLSVWWEYSSEAGGNWKYSGRQNTGGCNASGDAYVGLTVKLGTQSTAHNIYIEP